MILNTMNQNNNIIMDLFRAEHLKDYNKNIIKKSNNKFEKYIAKSMIDDVNKIQQNKINEFNNFMKQYI